MKPFDEGGQAYLNGVTLGESPYSDGRAVEWMEGWTAARDCTSLSAWKKRMEKQ